MSLDSSAVEKINQRVYREYPEMRGARPSVTSSGKGYTLVYKATAQTPAGPIARVVRVVTDERGKVSRLSTSK
jgi:type IV secretory pathway VirJ component